MVIQQIRLENKKEANQEEIKELLSSYLHGLLRNGQVWGEDFVLAWQNNILTGFIKTPEAHAINHAFNSEYTNSDLNRITEMSGDSPTWLIIETFDAEITNWKKEKSLYLFTHAFDDSSPVCANSNGMPIPLYQLGISDDLSHELVAWLSFYRNLDQIWFHSSALEMEAYKEMASIKSIFYAESNELRQKLEDAIKKPVYYYLMRYWGRWDKDQDRLCSKCGSKWKTDLTDDHSPVNFKCINCRLVSDMASSFEDERKARIGEYKAPRKKIITPL